MAAREVILGVGGGIAAYKSCDLLRRLQDKGFAVTVIPTPSSLNFVGAATWEALSGRPVTTSVWERVDEVRHVKLAKEAEYILVAPATADLIARIAQGRADDLLTNTLLASTVPVLIVPAMHPAMWTNHATQANVQLLRERGYFVMEPDVGALTSGDVGVGRFPETSRILTEFFEITDPRRDLIGKKVLVTAGGTREALDPIRFIGNNSSGIQGYAVARAAAKRGAEVTLILGPSIIKPLPGIKTINIVSAQEMFEAVSAFFDECDILVMSAAVADARPSRRSESKIKKDELSAIELLPNPDIIATVAARKTDQCVIAFAAETSLNIEEGARKLQVKGADILYLNDVVGADIFASEQTQGVMLVALPDGKFDQRPIERISKDTLADLLLDQAVDKLG